MRSIILVIIMLCISCSFSKKFFEIKTKQSQRICKIDPDYTKTIDEIIISRGYPLEIHYITTKDGYILKLFRIPGGKNSTTRNSKPCLLVHGLLDSADSFIISYEERSYSYYLANNGYDVWIANSRGNKHSRKHSKLNPDSDKEFWNFSYHEMGIYDIPAIIDHIKEHTKVEKITYFGHSQGNIQIFAAMSIMPEYFNANLNGIISLGPVSNLANIGSNFLSLVASTKLDYILSTLGVHEFLPSSNSLNELTSLLCNKLQIVCDGVLNLVADSNPGDDDQDKFDVFISHFPSGTSLKDLMHIAQSIRNKNFAQFDYGTNQNMVVYGQKDAPEYDLLKIMNKVCLFVGKDDRLATIADNRILRDKLQSIGKLVSHKEYDNMGHLTFFVPKDFTYNQDIMNCLKEFEK